METNAVISQIGNTPLVRLKQASELTGCHIYGKAEYFNPGESVKDRAALFIVQDAIKRKLIYKGGTIVEGTAGNTGIGLAIVCKEYDLKLKIVIPNTQSNEKKETLRKLGAELIEVDAVPYSDPKNYIKQSKKIADDLNKTNPTWPIPLTTTIKISKQIGMQNLRNSYKAQKKGSPYDIYRKKIKYTKTSLIKNSGWHFSSLKNSKKNFKMADSKKLSFSTTPKS